MQGPSESILHTEYARLLQDSTSVLSMQKPTLCKAALKVSSDIPVSKSMDINVLWQKAQLVLVNVKMSQHPFLQNKQVNIKLLETLSGSCCAPLATCMPSGASQRATTSSATGFKDLTRFHFAVILRPRMAKRISEG